MRQKTKSNKTALVQAVDLLARQEHSTQKLREKLRQRGYEEEEIEVTGTVVATRQGVSLDTGDACYLLREPLPVGYIVRARGTVHRGVIHPDRLEAVIPNRDELQRRLDRFLEGP